MAGARRRPPSAARAGRGAGSYHGRVIHAAPTSGTGDAPRRLRLRRSQLAKAAALLLIALATWLAWRAYQQPELLLELSNLMALC